MKDIRYGPPEPQLPFEHTIHIRLTTPQLESIQKMSEKYGTPPSTLVRHFVMQAIEQLEQMENEDEK